MLSLKDKKCIPCESGTGRLNALEIRSLLNKINTGKSDLWILTEDHHKIEKTFKFFNFTDAILFINKVAEIAEDEGHHPDISLFNWNKIKISLSTHAVKGLTENDFILAAKIDTNV